MTDKNNKFDINTIDVESSSQESKFHVDEPNSDVIDKFESIAEEYAGSGLIGNNAG